MDEIEVLLQKDLFLSDPSISPVSSLATLAHHGSTDIHMAVAHNSHILVTQNGGQNGGGLVNNCNSNILDSCGVDKAARNVSTVASPDCDSNGMLNNTNCSGNLSSNRMKYAMNF